MNPQQQPHPDTQLTRPGFPHPAGGAFDGGAWALSAPSVRRNGEADDPQPLHKIHRLLRGRYGLVVSLSLILAFALAAAGYLIPKPQYRSDGLIEIKPNIPKLDDTTIVMPLYTQYVESQVNMVLNQRVIASAMESDEWKTYGKGISPEAMKEFVEKLEVEYVRGTFLIRVSFTDPDPARAQAAVGAVVRSYLQYYGDEDAKDLRPRMNIVNDMITNITRDKNALRERLLEASRAYGTESLGELHAERIKEMLSLEHQLTQAKFQLISAQAALGQEPARGAAAATQPAAEAELTLAQLSKYDPRLNDYVIQQQQAADERDRLRARLGPNHPMVAEAEKRELAVRNRRDELAAEIRAQNTNLQVGADGRASAAVTPKMVEQLKQNVDFLTNQAAAAASEVTRIGNVNMTIQTLQKQIKDLDEKLADANRTRDQLNVAQAMSGRIQIQSYGDKPVIPAIDRRRQAAILGFLGGGSVPFVLFMLVGLADKRYRYSDETKSETGNVPLLGILPNLPDLLTDPQQAAIAAHCVHQIRTLLQVGVRTHDRHVYAITSAAPGDGKTSLTLALGLSFAASGSRTLLIDCDLVGGSLTRRLGVHAADGMLEAMASRSPMDFVHETDVNDLSILPVGSATMLSAGSFSPAGLRRLIAEARKNFDIVLIDTGPILGSIEAPPVAATADATILCVSRGQQRPAVDRSMHHLLAIGAKMAGIVFNRAEARDFEKSVSRFSQRSIRSSDYRYANGNGLRLPGGNGKTDPDGKAAAAAGVDPVTRAVASDFKGENSNDPR